MTERNGEIYYDVGEIQKLLKTNSIQGISVLSVELFKISDDSIVPFAPLQSIDSLTLYDPQRSRRENAELCNMFISNCILKKIDDLKGVYCTVITDDV